MTVFQLSLFIALLFRSWSTGNAFLLYKTEPKGTIQQTPITNGLFACKNRLDLVQSKTPDMLSVWIPGQQNQLFCSADELYVG